MSALGQQILMRLAGRLGVEHAASRLGISEQLLRDFVTGAIPVPDAIFIKANNVLDETPQNLAAQTNGDAASTQLSSDEIYRLIQEAAYLKAEARGFAPGVDLQDWLDAEREVLERLARDKRQP